MGSGCLCNYTYNTITTVGGLVAFLLQLCVTKDFKLSYSKWHINTMVNMFPGCICMHARCKKKLVVLTTEWLPWLQTCPCSILKILENVEHCGGEPEQAATIEKAE